MGAITPSFVFDFESNMQSILENEYARMAGHLWYPKVTRTMQSAKKKEVVAWLLSTAQIYDQGKGGNIKFADLVAASQTFVIKNAGGGLRLRRDQLEDNDGNGLDLAGKWAADMGAYMAYWPQKQVATAILAGESGTGYDGKAFFATDHPVNPVTPNGTNYANLLTSSSSGSYPGALKIDSSVTLDTALDNLSKAIAYIKGIRMPNGKDPRFLRPKFLIVPPALMVRAQQLTNAKYIAQAAGTSGGGASDIESVIANWGFSEPIEAPELSAAAGSSGSDTTWYLACEEISTSSLGALVYVDRKPFEITYYTGQGGGTGVDAILDRARELEWHCQGRNVTGYGHPYLLTKIKAA